VRYEDLTREQKIKLLMTDLDAYLAISGEEHLLMILDGIARTKKKTKSPSGREGPATPKRSPRR
jgi:hypothetical protein